MDMTIKCPGQLIKKVLTGICVYVFKVQAIRAALIEHRTKVNDVSYIVIQLEFGTAHAGPRQTSKGKGNQQRQPNLQGKNCNTN